MMRFLLSGLGIALSIFLFFTCVLSFLAMQIPSTTDLKGCMTTRLYKVKLCPTGKEYVPLSQISPIFRQAVILSEDSSFYQHRGFDWDEMKKSIEKNMEKKAYARGGSTITQQLAKNLFLSKEKSLWRKINEAIITLRIEKSLKKGEILERYLNVVQFGKNIFGVKQAALVYFNKAPANLNVIEGAFLTFLLPAPEKYAVSYYRQNLTSFARKRMSEIIGLLHTTKHLSDEEYQRWTSELPYFPKSPPPIVPDLAPSLAPNDLENAPTPEPTTIEDLEQVEGDL